MLVLVFVLVLRLVLCLVLVLVLVLVLANASVLVLANASVAPSCSARRRSPADYAGFAGAPCKPFSWAWFALSDHDREIYDLVGAYNPLASPPGHEVSRKP